MSRAKKDATAALKHLAQYLRHDPGAAKKAADIGRYVGELRQTQTSLKEEIVELKRQLEASGENCKRLSQQIGPLKTRLDREVGAHRQTRSELAASEGRIRELEKEVEPDDVFLVDDKLSDSYGFNLLMKDLKKRMRKPPVPARLVTKSDCCRLFDLEDVVTSSSRDQFTTLGMFVAVATELGFFPAFRSKRTKSIFAEGEDGHKTRAIRWMRSWIRPTKRENEEGLAFDEMVLKHTGQPPRP